MSVAVPVISSIDGALRRIYLLPGVSDYFPIEDVYHEYRNRRRLDTNSIRKYEPLLKAEGNVPKGNNAFTPRYVVLLNGTKIVPFNNSIEINQLGDMITDDPDTDPTLYDVSSLTVPKVIFIQPSEAEIIQLNSQDIQYSSFQGGVYVDELSANTGTLFPNGTPRQPVNNVVDAKSIADSNGFNKLVFVGDFTFTTGDDVRNFVLEGENPNKTLLTFDTGALTQGIDVFNSSVQGIFDDEATFEDCRLYDISMVEGYAYKCVLAGLFLVSGNSQTGFYNCWDGITVNGIYPIIDCGGAGRNIGIKNFHGDIKLVNKTGIEDIEININSGGTVYLDSTINNGLIRLTGSLKVIDETVAPAIVDISEVAFPDLQQYSAFVNNSVWLDPNSSNTGTKFPIGTIEKPVNNDSDAELIALKFNLYNITARDAVTITSTHTGIKFFGRSPRTTQVTIDPSATLNGCEFEDMLLTGDLGGNGSAYYTKVAMKDLTGIFGHAENCIFREGTITIFAGGLLMANKCASVSAVNPSTDIPIINCNGTGRIAFRNFQGEVIIQNKTGGNDCSLSLNGAKITLDSTITFGNWRIFGNGSVVDNSGGTAVVDLSGLVDGDDVQFIKDVSEGDVIPTPTSFTILNKLTKEVLVEKIPTEIDDLTQLTEPT
jgi:hypothetical protein